MDKLLDEIESDHIIVDFHAEATSENMPANILTVRSTLDRDSWDTYITDVGMSSVLNHRRRNQTGYQEIFGVPERVYPEKKGRYSSMLFDHLREIKRISLKEEPLIRKGYMSNYHLPNQRILERGRKT